MWSRILDWSTPLTDWATNTRRVPAQFHDREPILVKFILSRGSVSDLRSLLRVLSRMHRRLGGSGIRWRVQVERRVFDTVIECHPMVIDMPVEKCLATILFADFKRTCCPFVMDHRRQSKELPRIRFKD